MAVLQQVFFLNIKSKNLQEQSFLVISVGYLLLPNLIFLLGWIRWYWAIPIASILLFAFFAFSNKNYLLDKKNDRLSHKELVLLSLVALGITFYTGIGNFTGQLIDFEKHNAVYHDLITKDWPVVYQSHQFVEEAVLLDYYLGWYLPVALLAKITTIHLTEVYAFIWSSLGLLLSLYWFLKICGSKNWWMILLFFFLGDLESVYTTIRFLAKSTISDSFNLKVLLQELKMTDIIFANFTPNYSCQMTQYEWAPQHSLGAWISTGLILHFCYFKRDNSYVLFLGSLVLLWSPFVAVGLLPIILISLTREFNSGFSGANLLAGPVLFAVMAIYYLAHFPQDFRWIWDVYENSQGLYKMPLFILIKFGLLFSIAYLLLRKDKNLQVLLITVAISLSLFPLIYIGYQADFTMRASSPAWFVLVALVVIAFKKASGKKIKYFFFGLMVLSCTRYIFYGKHFQKKIEKTTIVQSKPLTRLYEIEWFN
ncbi:MAG: hypothetical protein AAGI07_14335, partial [Bacteroidota bacterium]